MFFSYIYMYAILLIKMPKPKVHQRRLICFSLPNVSIYIVNFKSPGYMWSVKPYKFVCVVNPKNRISCNRTSFINGGVQN